MLRFMWHWCYFSVFLSAKYCHILELNSILMQSRWETSAFILISFPLAGWWKMWLWHICFSVSQHESRKWSQPDAHLVRFRQMWHTVEQQQRCTTHHSYTKQQMEEKTNQICLRWRHRVSCHLARMWQKQTSSNNTTKWAESFLFFFFW